MSKFSVLNSFFANQEWRIYLVFAIPSLAALLGMGLLHRAGKKPLRITGLILAIMAAAVPAAAYIAALAQLRLEAGGFSDIVLVLAAIPLTMAGSILLLGIAIKKLSFRRSWYIPLIFAVLIGTVTQVSVQFDLPVSEQNWAGTAVIILLAVLTIPFTWLCCRAGTTIK